MADLVSTVILIVTTFVVLLLFGMTYAAPGPRTALLVGGQLLGIPWALLAIPVAEIIRIVITELRDYRRAAQGASETAVATSQPPATSE